MKAKRGEVEIKNCPELFDLVDATRLCRRSVHPSVKHILPLFHNYSQLRTNVKDAIWCGVRHGVPVIKPKLRFHGFG